MRVCLIICLALATGLIFPVPSHAEYLLNCRLMDPHSPNFKRWCLGEQEQRRYLVKQCGTQGLCIMRLQNFRSTYSRDVAASKEGPLKSSGVGLSGGTAVSASMNGTVSSVSKSVGGVATKAGGLIGHTLSTVGF
jgi:hypothetical protein